MSNIKSQSKHYLTVLTLIALSFTAKAQTGLTMDYKVLYNSYIIKPTWTNLKQLLFTNSSSFKATMQKYKYDLATDGSAYIANTSVGSPYFMIKKETDGVTMIFTEPGDLVSSFKSELRQMIKGGNVSFEKGFEVYHVNYEFEGFKYRIKIALKDDDSGGLVGLTLM